MRILKSQFSRGLLCGALLGVLAGAAGLAVAAPGKKLWDELGDGFQSGYVVGFLDCLRIGRAYDQGGYLQTTFPLPTDQALPRHWVATIEKLYQDERHQKRELPQMIIFAGLELQKKFGSASTASGNSGLGALRKVFEARRKARLAERKKAAAAGGDKPEGASDGGKPEGDKAGEAEKGPAVDAAGKGDAGEAKP